MALGATTLAEVNSVDAEPFKPIARTRFGPLAR